MKKLTTTTIALFGIIITLFATSCSVQHRQKHRYRQGSRYNSQYQHENDRYYNDSYRHPRRY